MQEVESMDKVRYEILVEKLNNEASWHPCELKPIPIPW